MDLAVGAFVGVMLLLAKMGTFYLLTGGKNQRRIPFTDIGLRDFLYGGPIRKGLVDLGAGWLGAHMLPTNSTLGLMALSVYSITCMAIIFSGIFAEAAKSRITGLIDTVLGR